MINIAGHIFLYLPIVFAVFYYTRSAKLNELHTVLTTRAIYICSLIPFILLLLAFATSNFQTLNVLQNSYINDPFIFKVTSAWGSHEGSILLWVFLINFYGLIFSFFHKKNLIHKQLIFISQIFIIYILLSSNPFVSVNIDVNTQGLGLNPILQNLLFVIHPPILFLGYLGLIIPFVIASFVLTTKEHENYLFQQMLLWSKISWFFLTVGITLGSYWAYSELGWGGWWFWDPVENVSLIPWLLNTALVHSLQVSIKNNQLKLWSLNLALYGFIAAVFGTFLVRSNLIVSVHSFAADPLRGLFLIIIIGYLLVTTIRMNLKSISLFNKDTFQIVSKESFLLINNIFFICAALTVFIGTVYPLFSEMIFQTAVSVGAPYYNFTFNILLAPIIILMAFAPQIKWQKNETQNKLKPLIILITSFLLSLICYYFFNNPFFAISVFITAPLFIKSLIVLFTKFKKDLRFYSQWLAHLSIGFFIIAAVSTEQFDTEENLLFQKGENNQITLNSGGSAYIENIQNIEMPNHVQILLDMKILEGNKTYSLSPSKNIYQPSGQITNEVSVANNLLHQYYATISEIESDLVSINLVYKPYINLLWFSAIMLIVGIFGSIIRKI